MNNYVTFYRNIKKKRAQRGQLKSWLPTGHTTPAPRSSPTTRSTATAPGISSILSPMPSGESECVRARGRCDNNPLTYRRHFKRYKAEPDTKAARSALHSDLKSLVAASPLCAQFGTPLVSRSKSCLSPSVNRLDSSRKTYRANAEVICPPPPLLPP